jgi:hypothetical protein
MSWLERENHQKRAVLRRSVAGVDEWSAGQALMVPRASPFIIPRINSR